MCKYEYHIMKERKLAVSQIQSFNKSDTNLETSNREDNIHGFRNMIKAVAHLQVNEVIFGLSYE